MLSFRQIEKTDIDLIRKITAECGIQSCDFTLCGLCLWGGYYKYQICFHKNTLFVKGVDEAGVEFFTVPIGTLTLKEAINEVRDYCRAEGIRARFSFVPKSLLDEFSGARVVQLEGWSDYIYSAELLKTLAGKQLHKKKNRLNKFLKTYQNHRFLRAEKHDLARLREFYNDFLLENPSDSDRLVAEEAIIKWVLEDMETISLDCGILEVDERIVGFAIGERVGDTLYVHFEKALRSYDGAFEAVNCMFVREFAGDASFVDREEDMNDLGLRQAKNSYCPAYLVDKYVVTLDD